MNRDKVRQVELEIEELNDVQNEGEDLDTVDGFIKFVKKQLDKIRGKDKNKAHRTPAPRTAHAAPQRVDRGQGDEDTDIAYDFSYPERGLAVIINNENFYLTKKYDDRPGSTNDEAALFETFKNLGFTVWVKKNLRAWQIVEVLKLARDNYDHAVADCFACAILSHGDETLVDEENEIRGSKNRRDMLFGIDGQAITSSDIVSAFSDKNCPTLRGKPRLFFLQACRGHKLDHSVNMFITKKTEDPDRSLRRRNDRTDQGNQSSDSDMTDGLRSSIRDVPACPTPLYKDCMVMYATPPGHFAWRRTNGSWFVQTLCSILDSEGIGQKSLLNALTLVVGRVARDYQSENASRPDMHQKKETPVIESMLVKDVLLTRK